jgi:signal peptidase I
MQLPRLVVSMVEPSPISTGFAMIVLLAVIMTGWVAMDAARRGRNGLAWAILVAATGPFGLISWLVVRRRYAAATTPPRTFYNVELFLAAIPLLLITVMSAAFIVTFLFEVVHAETQAMSPTLANRDRLIVNKLAYWMGDPQVGDIVMLRYPLQPEKWLVKRVIATEGDQVRIVDGKVYRNDVLMDDSFVPPGFKSHDNWGPTVIPQGYYFVMGDHRNNSSDSRHWGFVPKKYITGKVKLRWWPLTDAHVF